MIIKADELKYVRPDTPFKDGKNVTLLALQSALKEAAEKAQILIAFKNGQIESKGWVSSTAADCLVVYHPEHPSDYYCYVIHIKREDIGSIVEVKRFGTGNLGKTGSEVKEVYDNLSGGNVASGVWGGAKIVFGAKAKAQKAAISATVSALSNVGEVAAHLNPDRIKNAISSGISGISTLAETTVEEQKYYNALERIFNEVITV